MALPQIGERRSYDGVPCTVRYVGEVAGTSGSWLGVEWDDPSRGKHDGQHKGVRYFSCTIPDTLDAYLFIHYYSNHLQAHPNPPMPRPSSAPRAQPTRPRASFRRSTSSTPVTRPKTRPRPGRSSSRARLLRRSASKKSAASRPSWTSCSSSSSMACRLLMRQNPRGTATKPSARSAPRLGSWI